MKHCKFCNKDQSEIKSKIVGSSQFITLSCNHTIVEKIISEKRDNHIPEAAPASKIPVETTTVETPFTKDQVEMIAGDLMKYHGIAGRFNFHFDDRKSDILGICKCRVTSDGIIIGSITINTKHALNDSRSEVIETILHEIAHAITPGAQHSLMWVQTSKAIGGNGQAKAWCDGSKEIKFKICPVCHAKAEELWHEISEDKTKRIIQLICGHQIIEDIAAPIDTTWKFADNRQPYPFQYKGIDFARESGFRCGILDEMGLGKTLQGVGILHKFPKENLPALIVCKASLTYNWLRELYLATGKMAQILETSSKRMDMFDVHIVSFDTLARMKNDVLDEMTYKTIIIDECQQIKNHDAKRTNAVRRITKLATNVIALSGTPIKNNAGEYFPILNILRPEIFPSYNSFFRNHVSSFWDGYKFRSGNLSNPEHFAKLTKDFLIRRTVDEVKLDMPSVRHDFKYFSLGAAVKKAYEKELADFNDFYMNSDEMKPSEKESNILGYMSRMRHITGFSKIEPVVDYVEEYLEGKNGDAKITIFHHHEDVGDLLEKTLSERIGKEHIVRMKSSHSAEERMALIDDFRNSRKVFIVPTLAGGEGINLQFCNKAILMEPEWNPANEEQAFPGRFRRIGFDKEKLGDSVEGMIPVALGTIDEYLVRIKEAKKKITDEAYTGKKLSDNISQGSVMSQLADALFKFGMQGWRIEN